MFFKSICPIWLWHHLEGAWVVIIVVIVTGVVHIRENYTNFIKNYQKKRSAYGRIRTPVIPQWVILAFPLLLSLDATFFSLHFLAISFNDLSGEELELGLDLDSNKFVFFKIIRILHSALVRFARVHRAGYRTYDLRFGICFSAKEM